MNRFLLDANISPRTGEMLRSRYGFDVVSLGVLLPLDATDEDVVATAIRENRIIITQDVGFGALYFRFTRGAFGALILKSGHRSLEASHELLVRFFDNPETALLNLSNSLITIDDHRIRVKIEP